MAATGPGSSPEVRPPALRAETDGLVLSAFTRAGDREGLVLRDFNPGPREAMGRFALDGGTRAAFRLDLLERRAAALPLVEGAALVEVRAHGIETIELVPEVRP